MRGLSALRTRLLSLLGFSLYMAERENVNCIGEKIRLRAERQKNGLFEKVYFFKQAFCIAYISHIGPLF